MIWSTAIQSAESIQHLTGNGLFGVFTLLLLVIGMEKWVSYKTNKDRITLEQARLERNDKELAESRRVDCESRDKLTEALNGLAEVTAVNSEKIDQVQQDIQQIGTTLGEHAEKIRVHTEEITELKKK